MNKLLVTGSSRPIGSEVVRYVECNDFTHSEIDIRDRKAVLEFFSEIKSEYFCHTAAQPSHDLAASGPFDDFDVNAVGPLNFPESARRYCPEPPFVHINTNKVYGDGPNHLDLVEQENRWEYADGFLSYRIKVNRAEENYTIFGYQGKQVRNNIHFY